ncbi:MAG: hypothetical protein FWC95_03710 [Defluviitaleaceae bacterium]|nr:hypothetical protein [Defluviitaleaceae bacterium]
MLKNLQEAINTNLKDERKDIALDFAALLDKNGIFFTGEGRDWSVGGVYGNSPGYMMLDGSGNNMGVWLNLKVVFDDNSIDSELKKFILDHVVQCPQSMCAPPHCKDSKNRFVVLGKEFTSTCHSPLAFLNPDAATYASMVQIFSLFK